MKTPLYRQALAHSWRLAIKHTWLWPLGLFAALLGQMGMVDLLFKASAGISEYPRIPAWLFIPDMVRTGFDAFRAALPPEGWTWLILLLVILLALFATIVFVAVVSQGALVDMAARSVKKRKRFPDVAASWHVGVSHFWRIFFINILKKIVLGATAVFILWAGASMVDPATMTVSYVFYILFFLALLIGMVLSFLLVYAVGYVVVEEYPLFKSICAAWKLFLEHPLVSLEVGFLILFANVAVMLIALFGTLLLFLPAMILFFVTVFTGSIVPFGIGLFMGFLFATFFIIFLGSVFAVFTTSTWTYLFMHMHKKGIASRFLHLFRS